MSVQTDLLFLHGINDSQDKPWDVTLAAMLGQAGFPEDLAGVRLLVPSYLSQLDGKDLSSSSPARTAGRTRVRTKRTGSWVMGRSVARSLAELPGP